MASARQRLTGERGQALVELALLLPVLLAIVAFSVALAELSRARLKLLELARGAAWDATSYSLNAYGAESEDNGAEQREALRYANATIEDNLAQAYQRLDPTGIAPFGPGLKVVEAAVRLEPRPLNLSWGATQARLQRQGKIFAKAQVRLELPLVPPRELSPTAVFSLVADDGHLSDGIESRMIVNRAGRHVDRFGAPGADSDLYRQVHRLLGAAGGPAPELLRGLGGLFKQVGVPSPDFAGTFVVSHSYLPAGVGPARGCPAARNPAPSGANDLEDRHRPGASDEHGYPGAEPQLSGSDQAELRCFDTAPFRDQPAYEDSLYVRIFMARGARFMGCKNPMADDPAHDSDPDATDVFTQRVDCG